MMRRSMILDTTVRLVFDAALVLSIYLLLAGHNQPGGGFVGGLVAAAAIALRHVAGGISEVRSTGRVRPWTFMAIGLVLAAGVATWPLLLDGAPLDQRVFLWRPTSGWEITFSTTTVFDAGVYLIVVGLVLMIFEAFGDDPEDDVEPAPEGDR